MAEAAIEKAMDIIRQRGVVRPRDLAAYGVRRDYLAALQQRGLIQRVGRGLYVSADYQSTEHHTLAEASKRVPHAIVTLLSA
ncbi:MAG: type IV toxin-antitoxin system AbiEi family antitoxin domain-containing protein [Armatimonadota bacterium]